MVFPSGNAATVGAVSRATAGMVVVLVFIGRVGISLLAEWIANDKPLWVRFEGHNYFPVVKFYPEDVLLKWAVDSSGLQALAASAAFAPDSANWMVWPLIRSGPLESARRKIFSCRIRSR